MSINIGWIAENVKKSESVSVVMEIFKDQGPLILSFMFPKCIACNNTVYHHKSLPCSRQCLDIINMIYDDNMLCMFPREYLPNKT